MAKPGGSVSARAVTVLYASAVLAVERSRIAVALTADRPWSQVADAVGLTVRCIR